MAVDISYGIHGYAFPSKLLAQNGGKHIYNIKIAENRDNGSLCAKGDFIELDYYEEKEANAGDFEAYVRVASERAGCWFVEVEEPSDALLLIAVPVNPYKGVTRTLGQERLFYNAAGDNVRAYELGHGDVFEISEDMIEGDVVEGAKLTIANYKLKVNG